MSGEASKGGMDLESAYNLHRDEIRNFANLAAALLGYNLAQLDGAERLKECHRLLVLHPYAYPFALDLSLRLPAPMAITWLRRLRETFYAREDVQTDIDQFQIWRMQPVQALQTVLRIFAGGRPFLPSALAFLDCKYPTLGRAIRNSLSRPGQNIYAKAWQWLRCLVGKLALFIADDSLLRFYLRHASKDTRPELSASLSASLAALALAAKNASGRVLRNPFPSLPFVDDAHEPDSRDLPGLDIVTVIWGDDYIRLFGNINAPSFLASGNLPALSRKFAARMLFYTRREDAQKIRSLPVYQQLRRLAAARFIFIDSILSQQEGVGLRFADKYAPMTACHNHALPYAALDGRYLFFNFPDMVWQNDCLAQLSALVEKGKTHIFYYPGPYLAQESAEKCFSEFVRDNVLDLDNRRMREICATHRHPASRLFLPDAPLRYFGAIMQARLAQATGLAINMACFGPLLLKPEVPLTSRSTIDDDQPIWPLLNPECLEVISGNASLCAASLEKKSGQDGAMRWPPYTEESFAHDLRLGLRLWNRLFFSLTGRYYGTDSGDETQWQKVCANASLDAEKVQNLNGHKLPVPPLELFLAGVDKYLVMRQQAIG